MSKATGGSIALDIAKTGGIAEASLNKFRDGGAAMLMAEARNHIIVMEGANAKIPLTKIMARELNISYATLARANIAAEVSP